MKIQLDDFGQTLHFAPLTLTRPIGDLRCGLFTNTERWEYFEETIEVGYKTADYLQGKFPAFDKPDIIINGALIPNEALMASILALGDNSQLFFGEIVLASKGDGSETLQWKGDAPIILSNRWELFTNNAVAIQQDFEWFTRGRVSQTLSDSNRLIGEPSQLFIEEGAIVEGAILNVKEGPIYIKGKN